VKVTSFLRRPAWVASIMAGLAASVWIAHASNTLWDYQHDGGPPIDALVNGRFHEFLAARPVMGPLSLVYRAPFAALGQLIGHGGPANLYLDDYRYGVFACLIAAFVFGVALGHFLEGLGRSQLACAFVALVSVVNPVTLRAVHFGHPEEVLGAAFLTASMLAAVLRRPWLSLTLLACAVLNKQWGLIGAPAVVLTLGIRVGWARLRTPALVMLGLAVALLVPLLVVDANSFWRATKELADLRGTFVFPASIWYGFAPDLPPLKAIHSKVGLHDIPTWLGLVARPLIIAMGIAVPLAFMRRLRQDVLSRAFPLLALVMLLRCALDPEDNSWYHAPFLLALVAADGIAGRFYATAFALFVLAAPNVFNFTPEQLGFFYACWTPAFAVYLGGRAYGLDWGEWLRTRVARAPGAAQAEHPTSSAAQRRTAG
jgi:hypothetical protein